MLSPVGFDPAACRPRRQAFEQYRTSAQTFFHFLRQANGRWQTTQVLVGRSDLAIRLTFTSVLVAIRSPRAAVY